VFKNKKSLTIFVAGGLGNILFQANTFQKMKKNAKKNQHIRLCPLILFYPLFFSKVFKLEDHDGLSSAKRLGIKFDKIKLSDWVTLFALLISKSLNKNFFNCLYLGRKSKPIDEIYKLRAVFCYFQTNYSMEATFINYLKRSIKSSPLYEDNLQNCVVHFRGGDFSVSNEDNLKKYYRIALSGTNKFLVVTNDTERAKIFFSDLFPSSTFKIVKSKDILNDFLLLSHSKTLVSSNSTFSWWAAELSDAKVYQPKAMYDFFWNVESTKPRNMI
jgi:hypothetical protein